MQFVQARGRGAAVLVVIRGLTAGVALAAVAVVGLNLAGPGSMTRSTEIADETVVAELSGGPIAGYQELVPLLAATRDAPGNVAAAEAAAAALIDMGRKAGNSRLVGAALGVLRPFLAAAPAAGTLRLAAEARQYQHDFNGALALLDRAIVADPQAVDAILMRSTIHLVQGDLDRAKQDCARIHALRMDVGLLCQSTALTLTDSAPMVARRLQALMQANMLDPALQGWATSLLGEIAVLQGQPEPAAAYLGQVIAADRFALRERLMLADLLLSQGKRNAVVALLHDAPAVDGVLIRRALATGDAEMRDEVAARVRLNLQLGLNAHSREDAMYFLLLARDPVQALERARVNWALQHEVEDARLLLQAADAAGQPAEGLPVLAWMRANKIAVPSLSIPASIAELVK